MAGNEQAAFAAVGAIVAVPTLVWAMGASALAGIKTLAAAAIAMPMMRDGTTSLQARLHPFAKWRREYVRATLYKARHRPK